MGASLMGHQCERYIWLTWRWVLKPTFPGRILRMFDTGNREESRLLTELRGIGAEVWERDPNTRRQWRVSACNGHFGGSLDGVAKGLPEAPKSPAVLEFKTHNDKSFTDMVKNKVQASKPQHYDQMQIYMGLMEIDRALYMAVNKNTDELYTEWVHFDQERFTTLMRRAEALIESPEPPTKLSTDPTYYVCKSCNFWKHCHGQVAAEANCRTCCHASPVAEGAWHCQHHDGKPDLNVQRDGCSQHLMIPSLVPYGEAVDGGQTWVAYKHRETGAMFVNGHEDIKDYGPVFSSKELHNCPGALLQEMASLKNEFPGSKVVSNSVPAPAGSGFDDLVSDDLDAVPVKEATPAEKKARRQNAALVAAMQEYGAKK